MRHIRDAEALRGARELDDRQARLDRVEGELEAVRRALNDCSARHTEQLARCGVPGLSVCAGWFGV